MAKSWPLPCFSEVPMLFVFVCPCANMSLRSLNFHVFGKKWRSMKHKYYASAFHHIDMEIIPKSVCRVLYAYSVSTFWYLNARYF